MKQAEALFYRPLHIDLMTVPPVEGACLLVVVIGKCLPGVVQETNVEVLEFELSLAILAIGGKEVDGLSRLHDELRLVDPGYQVGDMRSRSLDQGGGIKVLTIERTLLLTWYFLYACPH